MITKKIKPYWSIRIAILVLMSPLYVMTFFAERLGPVNIAAFSDLTTIGKAICITVTITYLLSLFILIRTAKAAVPLILLFVCGSTMMLVTGFLSHKTELFKQKTGANEYSLTIGLGEPVTKTDIYCNGIKLGQTPLTITDDEFYEKVKPWTTPPPQPRTSITRIRPDEIDPEKGDAFQHARLYWVPGDPFGNYAAWPPGEIKYPMNDADDNKGMFKVFADSKYWWHFENTGCLGITWNSNFAGGAGGSNNLINIRTNPHVVYPSINKHFPILVESLKRTNYKPDVRWLAHFQKYQHLLFQKLYDYVKKNPKAAPALDAVVKHQFKIGPEISRKDCARVLDEVMSRAEKAGSFTVPSIESVAAELVCAEHKNVLSKYYIDSLKWSNFGSRGIRGSGNYKTYRRDGKTIRNAVTEHLVNIYQPENLYNQLVYEYTKRDQSIFIALNYPRKESVKLFDHYLKKAVRSSTSMFGNRHSIDRTIRMFENINNPDLQNRMLYFVQNHATAGSHPAESFVKSRVKKTPEDPNLPTLITHGQIIDEHDKAHLIASLRSDIVSNQLNYLSSSNPRNRSKALQTLSSSPNPFADEFLIDSFEYYMRPSNKQMSLRYWVKATVGANTPRLREYLAKVFQEGGEKKTRLLKEMPQGRWNNPQMDWMVPLLEEVEGQDEQCQAATILSNIASERAIAVLNKWSKDTNKKIASNAKYQLDKIRSRKAGDRKEVGVDQKIIDDIISGKTKPHELLKEAIPFIWDGKKYIPETK